MTEKKKKFFNLRTDSLHTFKMRAWSLSGVGDWTDDIDIRTSGKLPIAWPSTAVIIAKPLFFFRSIRVTWTPLLGYPLRFSHYVLFRKDTTESEGYSDPTDAELLQSGQDIVNGNLENNLHFLKETSKFPQHTDQVKLDAGDSTDTGVLEEHQYHYWVWAVDINGQTSYMSSMGQGYLGPDNTEFGKPNTPTWPDPDRFETEVLIRNSWWCNVKVVWECVDGAEGYWIQTKEKAGGFWSLPFWVEHDPSKATEDFPHQQSVVLNNFLCDTKYNFKIRAVNVPLFLVSGWSVIETYETEKDPYPPDEIMNVSANRLRQGLSEKGEYIKITWDWPAGAIMLQQIEHFRVYRYVGSTIIAGKYVNYINLPEGHNLKPDAYSETRKFGGTLFIDDEVKELEDAAPVDPYTIATFFWNGEYGSHSPDDQKTAYINKSHDTEIGVLDAEAIVEYTPAGSYDGDYRLRSAKKGADFVFTNTAGSVLHGDGYISFRYMIADDYNFAIEIGLLNLAFPTIAENQNWIRVNMVSGQLWTRRQADGSYKEITHPYVFTSSDYWVWHHIEVRWSISTDTFQMRLDDGDWETATGGLPMTPYQSDCEKVQIGHWWMSPPLEAYHGARYDRIFIYDSFAAPDFASLTKFYHYWVTAVDIDSLESVATMPGVTIVKASDSDVDGKTGTGESYDRTSFSPPAAPELKSPLTSEDEGFNLVQVWFWQLYTVKMTWHEVDEATHYRVKIRIKPPGDGRDWGPWMYSAHIEEAHANADEPYPFFVYPLPLQKHTWIEWAVEASNLAGPTESSTSGEIEILFDTEPPAKPKTPIGRCYGILNLFGENFWAVVWLRWEPNPPYQGVKGYAIFEDGIEIATVPHIDPMAYFKVEHSFLRFGAEPAASHDYSIVAIGVDDVRSDESDSVTIDYKDWLVM